MLPVETIKAADFKCGHKVNLQDIAARAAVAQLLGPGGSWPPVRKSKLPALSGSNPIFASMSPPGCSRAELETAEIERKAKDVRVPHSATTPVVNIDFDRPSITYCTFCFAS